MNVSNNIPYYLEIIRNKGNCFNTLPVAKKALRDVKDQMDRDEWWDIYLALSHMELGEGPDELNGVLKKLMQKYNPK